MITCIVVKIIVGTDFQEQLQTVQIERKRNRREKKREEEEENTYLIFQRLSVASHNSESNLT